MHPHVVASALRHGPGMKVSPSHLNIVRAHARAGPAKLSRGGRRGRERRGDNGPRPRDSNRPELSLVGDLEVSGKHRGSGRSRGEIGRNVVMVAVGDRVCPSGLLREHRDRLVRAPWGPDPGRLRAGSRSDLYIASRDADHSPFLRLFTATMTEGNDAGRRRYAALARPSPLSPAPRARGSTRAPRCTGSRPVPSCFTT